MILIDTCGWIEWLTDGQLSTTYEDHFEQLELIIVPTSVQFELYKWVLREHGIQKALESIALTEQALVIPLSTGIALSAADFSAEYKLSFADAIIYSTARYHKSTLITSDDHFLNLPEVVYYAKTTK